MTVCKVKVGLDHDHVGAWLAAPGCGCAEPAATCQRHDVESARAAAVPPALLEAAIRRGFDSSPLIAA